MLKRDCILLIVLAFQAQTPLPSRVTLTIYDTIGWEIQNLIAGSVREAVLHSMPFDAPRLASGTYLYRLDVQPMAGAGLSFQATKKMTLVK